MQRTRRLPSPGLRSATRRALCLFLRFNCKKMPFLRYSGRLQGSVRDRKPVRCCKLSSPGPLVFEAAGWVLDRFACRSPVSSPDAACPRRRRMLKHCRSAALLAALLSAASNLCAACVPSPAPLPDQAILPLCESRQNFIVHSRRPASAAPGKVARRRAAKKAAAPKLVAGLQANVVQPLQKGQPGDY